MPVNKEGNDGILVCVFGLTSLQNIVYVDSERIKEGVDYMGWYVLGGPGYLPILLSGGCAEKKEWERNHTERIEKGKH